MTLAAQKLTIFASHGDMIHAEDGCCPTAQVFVMKELKQLANSKKENAVEGAQAQA